MPIGSDSFRVNFLYSGHGIIPGPFLQLEKVVERSKDGTARLSYWKGKIHGKIVAFAGSPKDDGTFYDGSGYPSDELPADNSAPNRIRNLRNKIGALSRLFSVDGKWLEVQMPDGSPSLKMQPRFNSFTFDEGLWFDTVNYSVEFQCQCIYFGTTPICLSTGPAEESWTLEPLEEFRPTYKLIHQVSASGINTFDNVGQIALYGWQVAQAAVNAALGYSPTIAVSLGVGTNYNHYNHNLTKIIDEPGGSYKISENWTLWTGTSIEDRTVDIKYKLNDGLTTVNVQGSLIGLSTGDDPTTRYAAAAAVFAGRTSAWAYGIAAAEFGRPLNPAVMATSSMKNKVVGSITFAFEYDNRPAVTAGFLTETIEVEIDHAVPVVAQIGVIGRMYGPVLQPIGSVTQQRASVKFEGRVSSTYQNTPAGVPTFSTYAIFVQYVGTPRSLFLVSDVERWAPRTGVYSRVSGWIYQEV